MEAFFWLILLTGGLACSCAEPNLLISEEIVGVWRQSVILPCSYTPSPEYVEETVIWSFDGRAILRVVDHTEHVFLTKYRNRISLVRARAGDVSLRINSLQMNDKGHYRCEVGWRSDTIGKIQNDATMQLRISRVSPVTENPNIEVVNTQRHPSTAVPSTTKKSKIEEINTQRPGRTAVPSATKNYEKEVNIQRTGLTAGEPVLIIIDEINGRWRDSVIIPCSYMPSAEYIEETVIWSFGGRTILRMEDSVEHIYLTRNRGKLGLSRSHPGDVSLRIDSLQMDDKGQYKCEVIWRSKSTDGKTQKDAMIKLNILRGEPSLVSKEEISGHWRGSVVIPCMYASDPDYVEETVIWSLDRRTILRMENSVEHVYLTKHRGRLSLSRSSPGDASLGINNLQMDDKGRYNCEVMWRSKSTNGKLQKDAATTLKIIRAPPAAAGAFGIPLYLVILICVLCIAMVAAAVTILITKKRKKPSQLYEVPNMAAMLVREGESCTQANGCQRCEEPRSRRENEYETGREGTYEKMETVKEAEYEMLNYERAEKN
uniref:V-set and immunoglobulin domain-containing protein 4 isoform X2 n=1 Tax=Geotrypetes seraphini TaxID=260995 RepID=UPI00145875DC|nr:V-set and immunoglobulin domain-containing protein 4 isoform X2 [Geotrypetes seraphini]